MIQKGCFGTVVLVATKSTIKTKTLNPRIRNTGNARPDTSQFPFGATSRDLRGCRWLRGLGFLPPLNVGPYLGTIILTYLGTAYFVEMAPIMLIRKDTKRHAVSPVGRTGKPHGFIA